jgi:enoyl-CoA hydratase/carnithine racemase
MKSFQGKTLSWNVVDGAIEVVLDHAPCNEIGLETLVELERFTLVLDTLVADAHAIIISSARKEGFCAGADLRELYQRSQDLPASESLAGVRDFIERIHRVMNALDAAPLTTIAAVQGVTFGGGFELALACDLIIADKMTRFCFPELRLGLIPGFGGIPRLKRDLGNAVVRDLLLTGRSINATKAMRSAWRARQLRNCRNSTAVQLLQRNGSSSRFRRMNFAGKLKSFATFLPDRRSRPDCASSSKARTHCRICRRHVRRTVAIPSKRPGIVAP